MNITISKKQYDENWQIFERRYLRGIRRTKNKIIKHLVKKNRSKLFKYFYPHPRNWREWGESSSISMSTHMKLFYPYEKAISDFDEYKLLKESDWMFTQLGDLTNLYLRIMQK